MWRRVQKGKKVGRTTQIKLRPVSKKRDALLQLVGGEVFRCTEKSTRKVKPDAIYRDMKGPGKWRKKAKNQNR